MVSTLSVLDFEVLPRHLLTISSIGIEIGITLLFLVSEVLNHVGAMEVSLGNGDCWLMVITTMVSLKSSGCWISFPLSATSVIS